MPNKEREPNMEKHSTMLWTGGTDSVGSQIVPVTLRRYEPSRRIIHSRHDMKQWKSADNFKVNFRILFFIDDVRSG